MPSPLPMLFLIRDSLKKRVIYLFIHSTASGCSVLAFCTHEWRAECTVLSHLRDLLNSNVSRLRQKPSLQCCLNLHSKLACWIDLENAREGDLLDGSCCVCKIVFPRTCGQNPPYIIFIFIFGLDILEGCVLIDLKYNILQFSHVGCAISFLLSLQESKRALGNCVGAVIYVQSLYKKKK